MRKGRLARACGTRGYVTRACTPAHRRAISRGLKRYHRSGRKRRR